jgi:hypothetical protein
MDETFIIACGVVWRKTADPEAGWSLVAALDSPDPSIRSLAEAMLAAGADDSLALLEAAVEAGVLSPEKAAPCISQLLQTEGCWTTFQAETTLASGRDCWDEDKPCKPN